MNTDSYRALQLLEEISDGAELSQRTLAKKLGMAVGLINLLLRRMAEKGYIKVINVQRNRLRYLLTPQGIAEKSRLTYEYFDYSLYLYRNVRRTLQENLARLKNEGREAILLHGTGELAEIAYLTLREVGLNLSGIVADKHIRRQFLGYPVLSLADLPALHFDCLIVTSLDEGYEQQQRLLELGVPEKKILVLEQKGLRIRAVHPSGESNPLYARLTMDFGSLSPQEDVPKNSMASPEGQ